MASEVLKVGPKYQVTIPKSVRTQLGLKVGDLVQARVGKNHSIILERKRLVDFEKSLEEDLRVAQADYEAGRVLGPFATAEEAVKALNSPRVEKVLSARKMGKRAPGRAIKSAAHVRANHR
jgi:AbrB family looped-hinge helix DNA binding protein